VPGHVGGAALRFALRYLHSSDPASLRAANWLAESAGLRGAGLYVAQDRMHADKKMNAVNRRPIDAFRQITLATFG
jgi:hypothetical protein